MYHSPGPMNPSGRPPEPAPPPISLAPPPSSLLPSYTPPSYTSSIRPPSYTYTPPTYTQSSLPPTGGVVYTEKPLSMTRIALGSLAGFAVLVNMYPLVNHLLNDKNKPAPWSDTLENNDNQPAPVRLNTLENNPETCSAHAAESLNKHQFSESLRSFGESIGRAQNESLKTIMDWL